MSRRVLVRFFVVLGIGVSIAVFVDVQAGELQYVLAAREGTAVSSGTAAVPSPGRPLILLFPNRLVRQGQAYTLPVRQSGREIGSFPLVAVAR